MWGGVWARAWDHDHVYKDVPAIGEKFHAEQELDNAVDKFAEKVVKDNETVGHLRRILWYFVEYFMEFCGILSHVAERYAWK